MPSYTMLRVEEPDWDAVPGNLSRKQLRYVWVLLDVSSCHWNG